MESVNGKERSQLRHGTSISSGRGLDRRYTYDLVLSGMDTDDSSQGPLTGDQTILLQQDDVTDLSIST